MLLGGVAEGKFLTCCAAHISLTISAADLSDLKIEEAQQAPFVPKVRDHEDHEDHSPAAYRPHAGSRDVRDITATFLEASSSMYSSINFFRRFMIYCRIIHISILYMSYLHFGRLYSNLSTLP